ncbi:MAG TPA: sulfurtransferase [Aggregatilineales bacterium]|nr:sulfurtransferase [Aggregatilineales bacterium]
MTFNFPAASPHQVSADWLAQHLNEPDLRILDARLPEAYTEGHIPQAVSIQLTSLRYTKAGVEGMLVEPEVFAERIGAAGIGPHSRVVIYDDYFGQLAARIAWSLLRYGHQSVALLDGGWDAWEAAGLPVSTEAHPPAPAHFTPTPAEQYGADYDWVVARLGAPGVVLLDVRSPAEYAKGHLPGAVSWNWESGTALDATFAPAEALRAELAQLGVTPDKEIVTYCQSGMRAAHTFYLLLSLGFPAVRLYDGSWAEWSTREGQVIHAG